MGAEAKPKPVYRRKACRICCGSATALLVIIGIIILVLSLTTFKVKDPVVTLTGMTTKSFSIHVDPTVTNLALNVSALLDLSVQNPNSASFKHPNSTTFVYYRGREVGTFPVPAGTTGAKKVEKFVSELDIQEWHIILDKNALAGLKAGIIPITTYNSVRGTLNVMHMFKHHAISTSHCTANVLTVNRTLGDFKCKTKIKL